MGIKIRDGFEGVTFDPTNGGTTFITQGGGGLGGVLVITQEPGLVTPELKL